MNLGFYVGIYKGVNGFNGYQLRNYATSRILKKKGVPIYSLHSLTIGCPSATSILLVK